MSQREQVLHVIVTENGQERLLTWDQWMNGQFAEMRLETLAKLGIDAKKALGATASGKKRR